MDHFIRYIFENFVNYLYFIILGVSFTPECKREDYEASQLKPSKPIAVTAFQLRNNGSGSEFSPRPRKDFP